MSAISLETRKPVDKLTLSDFKAFPVWEYAIDEEAREGRDETWVRPVNTSVVPRRSYTHVAADFSAPCGKQFLGYVTVSTLDGPPDVCQGVIHCNRNYLFIPNPEQFRFEDSRKELLDTLGLKESELFPLSFRLCLPVAGWPKYLGGQLP